MHVMQHYADLVLVELDVGRIDGRDLAQLAGKHFF